MPSAAIAVQAATPTGCASCATRTEKQVLCVCHSYGGITKGRNTEGCDRLKLADASQDTSLAAVQCIGLEPTKYRYVILQFTGEEPKVQVLKWRSTKTLQNGHRLFRRAACMLGVELMCPEPESKDGWEGHTGKSHVATSAHQCWLSGGIGRFKTHWDAGHGDSHL